MVKWRFKLIYILELGAAIALGLTVFDWKLKMATIMFAPFSLDVCGHQLPCGGRVNVKVVPPPTVLSKLMAPP
jgi:hypothetical protein